MTAWAADWARLLRASWPSSATRADASCPSKILAAWLGSSCSVPSPATHAHADVTGVHDYIECASTKHAHSPVCTSAPICYFDCIHVYDPPGGALQQFAILHHHKRRSSCRLLDNIGPQHGQALLQVCEIRSTCAKLTSRKFWKPCLFLLRVTLVPGQGRMRLWLTALTASLLCSNYSRGRGHKADLLTPQLG